MTFTGWYLESRQRHITRVPTSRGSMLAFRLFNASLSVEAPPLDSTAMDWIAPLPAAWPLTVPLRSGLEEPFSARVGVSMEPMLCREFYDLYAIAKNICPDHTRKAIRLRDYTEELLEKIATNGTTWYSEKSSQRLVGGFHDVDQISALSAKVDNMASMVQKIAQITLNNQNVSYASSTSIPPRQIMMQQQFQPQGAYNPNASRNHPGFSWSNPMGAANPQSFGNRGPPPGFQGQQNYRGGQQQQQSRQKFRIPKL
nr:(-)-alpha-terpineol synthase-like [Ipomoea batatas]